MLHFLLVRSRGAQNQLAETVKLLIVLGILSKHGALSPFSVRLAPQTKDDEAAPGVTRSCRSGR